MPKPGKNRHRQLELLSDRPEFQEGQKVVRITKACGENIYEVENESGETVLYQLPSRLRNVAFIRRGSYVFVRDDPTRGPGKIRGDIEVVVLERFLRELRTEAFWPHMFKEEGLLQVEGQDKASGSPDESHGSDWEIGAGNPNRRTWERDEDSENDGEL